MSDEWNSHQLEQQKTIRCVVIYCRRRIHRVIKSITRIDMTRTLFNGYLTEVIRGNHHLQKKNYQLLKWWRIINFIIESNDEWNSHQLEQQKTIRCVVIYCRRRIHRVIKSITRIDMTRTLFNGYLTEVIRGNHHLQKKNYQLLKWWRIINFIIESNALIWSVIT